MRHQQVGPVASDGQAAAQAFQVAAFVVALCIAIAALLLQFTAGVDHVGIGSDFDGIDETPVGLSSVADFPAPFAELARRGWSDGELRKLAGENVLRVMERAEQVAVRLQRTTQPSTARLP